jgi:DNA-binding HxlR family transcriptional regulator
MAVSGRIDGPKGTMRILLALGELEESHVTELTRRLPVSRGTIEKAIARLEECGLVARKQLGGFPPKRPIRLTEEGRTCLDSIAEVIGGRTVREWNE